MISLSGNGALVNQTVVIRNFKPKGDGFCASCQNGSSVKGPGYRHPTSLIRFVYYSWMLHGNEISKEDEHGKYFSKRKKAGPVDPALVLERTMFDFF
jgi:hypothetical protein